MFQTALPILGVASSVAAEAFYCDQLGFRRAYVHRPNADKDDPCWMGVVRELCAAGVECGAELVAESWGHLEFNVRDPDGNLLNFAQDAGA